MLDMLKRLVLAFLENCVCSHKSEKPRDAAPSPEIRNLSTLDHVVVECTRNLGDGRSDQEPEVERSYGRHEIRRMYQQ